MKRWRRGFGIVAARVLAGLIAISIGLSPTAQAADATLVLPDRIIDVVQVTWTGAPTPTASAQSVADTIRTDTIARWKKISNGRIVFTLGKVLAPVQMRIQLPCDASGTVDYMNAVQLAAYQRDGITGWDSRYLVILSPRPNPDCVWDGRGIVNPTFATSGRLILKDTDDPTVIAHELGHNLGLGHSNFERCKNGKPDGPWEDCTAIEYGSATDLMGNNDRSSPLNAYHQWRIGWIADADVAIGNRTVALTLNPIDVTTGTRAVFLRDKSAAYWVELRRADPENGIEPGLVIYRSDPPPGSSVESPIASDRADTISTAVTMDVWMISLGSYTYSNGPGIGSPSLTAGSVFTTAFGGASIVATLNADGTAAVRIVRNTVGTRPATPILTDPAYWDSPSTEVLDAGVDDFGTTIVRFEARVTTGSGTRVVAVPVRQSVDWQRTFLNPVLPPTTVLMRDLPEGKYTLQLRAIDALDAVSEWSKPVIVSIDLGTPIVQPIFRASDSNGRITVEWVGAKDLGSGVCRAQVLNVDGFAIQAWSSTRPSVPAFTLAPNASIDGRALIHDCKGNGVIGSFALSTKRIPPVEFDRVGRWNTLANGDLRCVGECRASITTSASGTTSIAVRESSTLRVFRDGRLIRTVAATSKPAIRIIHVASGSHRVELRGERFRLTAATSVMSDWKQTDVRALRTPMTDSSLLNSEQEALSRIGFNQLDVIDDLTVRPLSAGTGTEQGTLDLCSSDYPSEELRIARRQVAVANADKRYSFISSETVRYQSAAAVRQALKEIDANVAACKRNGGAISDAGTVQRYEFLQLPTLPTGLVPETDRRVYLVNIGEGDSASTLLVVYQFRNDLLNALYVAVDGSNAMDLIVQSRWLQIAEILAGRLRGATK